MRKLIRCILAKLLRSLYRVHALDGGQLSHSEHYAWRGRTDHHLGNHCFRTLFPQSQWIQTCSYTTELVYQEETKNP